MQAQQEIMFEYNQSQVGTARDIILDQPVADQPGVWIGRGSCDAPDVDGVVFVTQTDHELSAGQIVECEIVASQGYDLIAAAIGKPSSPRKVSAGLNILPSAPLS